MQTHPRKKCIFHISSLLMVSYKTKNPNKCMVLKFNTDVQFKLNLRWLKYVDIIKLNNNWARKINPFHIICKYSVKF